MILVQVLVRDNNVDQALRALKKKTSIASPMNLSTVPPCSRAM
ncbi:30S ribosomal protein S21, partial [Rhizobium ruizarguesonis]